MHIIFRLFPYKSKAEAISKVDKDFSEFLPPSSIHSFAYFPTDPVEIMEELERLENKTSEDINGVSEKLLENISTEILLENVQNYSCL